MSDVIKESEKFAKLFFDKLENSYCKWYYLHSKFVGEACLKINPNLDKEIVFIAGWLHDIGKVEKNEGHAERSAVIAEGFLKGKISKEKLKIILDCIKNHSRKSKPLTREGKIFQKADKLSIFYKEVIDYAKKVVGNEKAEEIINEHYRELKSPKLKEIADGLLKNEN